MGAQNALWLTANVLLNQRRTAALENPCYPSLRDILTQSRCQVASVEVDAGGLPPDALPSDVDVVFTTPSHQCPTATTMPLERRRTLLSRAAEQDFLIVEDDYEFEMSFLKAPSPALKSLDREGRVIYVGSFSKSLFPGLRLGYLVGSRPFHPRGTRAALNRTAPSARPYSTHGGLFPFTGPLRRADPPDGHRLSRAAAGYGRGLFAHGLTVAGQGAFGGSSFWMLRARGVDTEIVAERLRSKGVLIEPGRPFFTTEDAPKNYYRLAYSSLPSGKYRRVWL